MRVKLRGVQKITKRLSNGKIATYYYLRGHGRLNPLPGDEGQSFKPGTVAFMRSYNALVGGIVPPSIRPRITDTFQDLILAYRASSAFTALKVRTQSDYSKHINVILDKWGTLPIGALNDVGVRPLFLVWRDERAKRSPRQADMTMTILGTLLNWAMDQGRIRHNYAAKPGRTYVADRSEMIWTQEQQDTFLAKCKPEMRLPFLIAINTGQREKDIIELTWDKVRDGRLSLRQSKRDRKVSLPFTVELQAALETERQRGHHTQDGDLVCLNTRQLPWTTNGLGQAFRRSMKAAGLSKAGLHFHDLRGTVCTMLHDAGCTNEEIGLVLGWKRTYVDRMLEIYKAVDLEASNRAIEKLESVKKVRSEVSVL